MIVLDLSILNQKGTPMFYSDLTANRPTAGIVGRIFIATDSPYGVFRDNGTGWDQVAGSGGGGISGSGTATQVAFWSTSSSISSSSNLYWDNTNGRLGIGNATPGVTLDVHGTNVITQLNGTGTTNSQLQFQNAGSSKWAIGNIYSAGTNYFRIYDVLNSSERVKITNDGQIATLSSLTLSGSPIGYSGLYNSTSAVIPAATTFPSLGYVYGGYNQYNFQNFGGNATYQNNNVNTAIFSLNRIDFSAAGGTITMTQATGVRAMSAAAFQNQYNGTNSGTITHLAGTEILGFYRSAGTGTLSVTNAYGLIVNNIDDYAAGFTYTNRWGIFQQGSSDNNYFAGKIITGTSTTVSTYQLDVTGTARITNSLDLAGASNYIKLSASGTGASGTSTIFLYSSNFTGYLLNVAIRNDDTSYGAGLRGKGGSIAPYGYFISTNGAASAADTDVAFMAFNSKSISINGVTEYASAQLAVDSTTKGFLPPRMTTTQKNAITSPATGLVIFDTTLAKLCVYTGAAWQTVTSV